MSDNKKPVVITITIFPPVGGKRKVIISGAPKGEMPAVERGLFSELHALIDRLWMKLATREPQVVDTTAAAAKELPGASRLDAASESSGGPVEPEELPEIEGDDLNSSQEDSDE